MKNIAFFKNLLLKEMDEATFTDKYDDSPKLKGKQTTLPDEVQAKIVKEEDKIDGLNKHKIIAQYLGPDFFLSKKHVSQWDEKDHDLFDRIYKMVTTTGKVPKLDEDNNQIRPDLKAAYDQGYEAGYAKCKYDMTGEFPDIFESEDHEVSMAHNSLKSIVSSASQLMNLLGNDEKDIPAWIQDHITNAENYINQASKNYHEYSNGEHDFDELPDGTEELPAGDEEDAQMSLQGMMEAKFISLSDFSKNLERYKKGDITKSQLINSYNKLESKDQEKAKELAKGQDVLPNPKKISEMSLQGLMETVKGKKKRK